MINYKKKYFDLKKKYIELLVFKVKVVRNAYANELTPEDFSELLSMDYSDDCN